MPLFKLQENANISLCCSLAKFLRLAWARNKIPEMVSFFFFLPSPFFLLVGGLGASKAPQAEENWQFPHSFLALLERKSERQTVLIKSHVIQPPIPRVALAVDLHIRQLHGVFSPLAVECNYQDMRWADKIEIFRV